LQGCWTTLLFLLPACFADVAGIEHTTTEFTPTQYHIQTDDGDRRFFKYQTWSGQVRKEDRLDDGTVVGSYGWVDANGILRLYDYVADDNGYRIVKTRLVDVKKQQLLPPDLEPTPEQRTPVAKKKRPIVDRFAASIDRSALATDDDFERQNLVDDRPAIAASRLQRRISTHAGSSDLVDVQPLFDFDADVDLTTTPVTRPPPPPPPRTTPASFFEARGEGFRTQFSPAVVVDDDVAQLGPRGVARSRSEDGRQRVVVRRRRPNALRPLDAGLDYQTRRAFHHEETAHDGKRVGQFGYIDPIGVRRVVNYSTGDGGEIVKKKENDFVGTDTYFEAS
jgi:hypothetical protein